jgi:hypothetical protein
MTYVPESGSDNYTEYQWSFVVPAFSKAAILHFAVVRQPNDAGGATSEAQALVNLTDPEALAGLTDEEKALIKNFIIQVAPAGGGQPEVQ